MLAAPYRYTSEPIAMQIKQRFDVEGSLSTALSPAGVRSLPLRGAPDFHRELKGREAKYLRSPKSLY
jgi:hypothetical protein